jgi:TolA-binding protein
MTRQTLLAAALLGAAWLLFGLVPATRAQDKPEAKSSPAAVQLYQDAASAQNGGSFEIAEEGWRKLLKDHPQDPLVPKAQHYLGVCLLQLKKPDQAAAAFQAVIKNHPKFELLEDTLLNLASCQYSQAAAGKTELYAAAGDTFASLIKQFPKSKFVPESRYFQGESRYAPGQKAESIAAYCAWRKRS